MVDARSLAIQPWDREFLGPVATAIQASKLGLTPNTIDGVIRLTLPALTEETHRALVKVVNNEGKVPGWPCVVSARTPTAKPRLIFELAHFRRIFIARPSPGSRALPIEMLAKLMI